SQVDQFCSTQLAAFVACSWASLSEGTAGDGLSTGAGEGPSADRTADMNTAGTSRCTICPPHALRGHGKVTGRDRITTLTGHCEGIRGLCEGETALICARTSHDCGDASECGR